MSDDVVLDELAGEYVLGTLDAAERDRFEARLRDDPAAAAAVADWQARLQPLADSRPEAPPARVWDAVARAIGAAPPPDLITIRAGEGDWHELSPGVCRKDLHYDPDTRTASFLMRFDPGASYQAHPHAADEHCLMLEGDLSYGDLELHAGDFHLAPGGTAHAAAVSQHGALVYVQAHAA